jgi:hypothetical protein
LGASLPCGLPRESAKRDDHIVPGNAEPNPIEVITSARDRDGAIRTAPSLVDVTAGDHLDKKDVVMRCTETRELSAAIEFGIIGFASGGGERENDAEFGFAADLGNRAGPAPGDCRP